jgi:hypothetical protein
LEFATVKLFNALARIQVDANANKPKEYRALQAIIALGIPSK